MSCQNDIDKSLSADGKGLRTITINGKSGAASIPELCAVTFINCTISSLTFAPNCVVTVCKSTLSSVSGSESTLVVDRCTINGSVSVTNTKSTWKLCTFSGSDLTFSSSSAEFLNCTRSGGSVAITANEGSTVKALGDFASGYETILKLDKSTAQVRNCNWVGIMVAIDANDSSFDASGGKLQGTDESTIKMYRSKGTVSGIPDTLVGDIAAIQVHSNSHLEISNCPRITGAQKGVHVTDSSTFTCKKFDRIRGTGSSGIRAEGDSTVTTIKGDLIDSLGAEAVLLTESSFSSLDVKTLKSTPTVALRADDKSSFSVSKFETILGVGAEAIKLGNENKLSLTDGTTVQGQASHALITGNENHITIRSVETITGDAGDGLSLGSENNVTLRDIEKLLGQTGTGIKAGKELSLTIKDVTTIQGVQKDGINCGAESTIKGSRFDLIEGSLEKGIVTGEGSTVTLTQFGKVIGGQDDAMDCPASAVDVSHGEEINAPVRGEAIQVNGSGGSIRATDIGNIAAFEGTTIHISGGEFFVSNCPRVFAGGYGVNASKSSGTIQRIARFAGFEAAVQAKESLVNVFSMGSIEGGHIGGMKADEGSVINLHKASSLTAAPYALFATAASQINASGVPEMSGDILSDAGSDIKVTSTELDGNVFVAGSTCTLENVDVLFEVSVDSGVLNFNRGSATVLLSAVSSAVNLNGVAIEGDISLTESGLKMVNSSCLSVAIVDSGAMASGGSVTFPTVSNGSWVHADTERLFLRSDALVHTEADQILDITT